MAYPGLTPLPPAITHSSTPLTHSEAYDFLSTFLTIADLDPSLRPDSVLTERGPTSSSSTANPNLTLTHLGRIKLGMEGKRSAGSGTDLDGFLRVGGKRKRADDRPKTANGAAEGKRKATHALQDVVVIQDGHDEGDLAITATEYEGGQDREDYDLAQQDEEVDVGNSRRNNNNNTLSNGGEVDVEETVGVEDGFVEITTVKVPEPKPTHQKKRKEDVHGLESGGPERHVDKDERKRLKRERARREKITARNE